jgi:hypothetical protein
MEQFSDVRIDRDELLRYLGYHGQTLDKSFAEMLAVCEKAAMECITPRVAAGTFSIAFVKGAKFDQDKLLIRFGGKNNE